jgi:hypothetical protein
MIGIVAIVLIGFSYSLHVVTENTLAEQKKTLENSIKRSVIHCYAVEGYYPESMDYLEEHYGIDYDKDVFVVDYQPFAENIMPDITVFVR